MIRKAQVGDDPFQDSLTLVHQQDYPFQGDQTTCTLLIVDLEQDSRICDESNNSEGSTEVFRAQEF